jgi:LacI family transcriptional regulator, gluconate utilization system Gnt-I transcriptional repressor
MTDIAREAGVSTMTVSRAFKRDSSVSPETRERILEVAERMGYVFDATASNLRSQRSSFVAVTVPTINNPNFAETVDALSSELDQARLQVLLGYDRYGLAEEEALIEQLLRRRPEAIVVTGGRHTDRSRRLLKASGVPVVETWDIPMAPIEHVVGFSNSASMELLVDHLVARGLRKIAFIGGDFSDDTRGADRRRGFVAAMKRRGLDPSRLIPIGGPSSVEKGAAAMAQLLESQPDIGAVIGVFDHAAFGALTECQRRKIRVPDDIAIAGFGATEIAKLTVPTLTTVDPHCAKIGQRAGRLIVDLLKHPERRTGPIRIEIEPVLRVGESTG